MGGNNRGKCEPTGIKIRYKGNSKEYLRQYHIKIRKPRALKEGTASTYYHEIKAIMKELDVTRPEAQKIRNRRIKAKKQ